MEDPANDDAQRPLRVITEDLLRAYAAGRLPPERRRDVEGYLACNPDVAARIMAERHMGVSLGVEAPTADRPGRFWRRGAPVAAGLTACLASAALGWSVAGPARSEAWREQDGDRAPAYVEEAAMSQRATVLRAAMVSQPETSVLDGEEVRRTLGVHLPPLPDGWRLLDVQVFPSDDGPGLNLTAQASDGRRLSLFVVQADTEATDRPILARRGAERAVFWEEGGTAFILGGEGSEQQLLEEAVKLAKS